MHPTSYQERSFIDYRSIQPSQVKGAANDAVACHKRYLWTKLYSVFKFTLPEQWELDWFRFWLFQAGSIAVIYTKEFGWICNPYGVTKLNLYYHPSEIIVTNHALPSSKDGVIGLNAEIVYLMDDFIGLNDIVTKYATKLAEIDKAIQINLMNANVSLVYEAEDKKQADTIKEAYGKATTGEPLVAINKDMLSSDGLKPLINNVKNTFIANDLETTRRSIVNEFLTEIGISNANTDKRERLVTNEVDANNEETKAISMVIFENIKKCFEKVNKISNLGLKVELRYNEEGGAQNEVDSIRDVSV